MSRSSASRAQTEPIAAIVAVAMVVIGLGLYAVAVQPLRSGAGDRTTAERTIDLVWDDIQDDGVFYAHAGTGADADPATLVSSDSLPAGSTVSVTVTVIDGDGERTIAAAAFPAGYPDATDSADVRDLERTLADDGPPADASVATRSIPVAVTNGADVRSGTLEVQVW
ncbi:DUF7285 family protein [Halopiger thermotolerans]